MIAQALSPTRPLLGVALTVAIGVLVALGTVLAVTLSGLAKVGFAIAGLTLLIPAFVARDPRAYGLFLLVFSVPINFSKSTTKWIAEPSLLFQQYGLPASGTLGVDIHVADVAMIALLLPWLAQLWLRRQNLYFPKAGYIFVLYLLWALCVSLFEASSWYLAMFELTREILYFVLFIYIVNNVVTRAQFRAVVLALVVGLVMESGAVITNYQLGIGSEQNFFDSLLYGSNPRPETAGTLTVSESGAWKKVARSAGTFPHPAHTAFYLEYILPIVLGSLLAARRVRDRILFGTALGAGSLSLLLTFSRAGMVGFLVASTVFFPLARWSRLISGQVFACFVFMAVIAAVVGTPLLVNFLASRPEAVSLRLKLITPSVNAFMERPIWGAGLNNSSPVTEGSRAIVLTPNGSSMYRMTVVHNFYLIVLVEVGIVGFLLFFGFFWQTAVTALRHMRAAETEMKLLLAAIVSSWVGIAMHNFADPFGGFWSQVMLYLQAGLVFAICRRVRAEPQLRGNGAQITP